MIRRALACGWLSLLIVLGAFAQVPSGSYASPSWAGANPVPPPANGAAIAYVQSAHANFATGTSLACTFPASVASGDLIAAVAQVNSTQATSISDTLTDTFTQAISFNGGTSIYSWAGTAKSTGANTVTISGSGSVLMALACLEYKKVTTLDQQASTSTTSTTPSTPTITTLFPNEVLIAIFNTGVAGVAINSPFTQRESMTFSGSVFFAVGDRIVSATGAYSASAVTGGSNALNGIASYH